MLNTIAINAVNIPEIIDSLVSLPLIKTHGVAKAVHVKLRGSICSFIPLFLFAVSLFQCQE